MRELKVNTNLKREKKLNNEGFTTTETAFSLLIVTVSLIFVLNIFLGINKLNFKSDLQDSVNIEVSNSLETIRTFKTIEEIKTYAKEEEFEVTENEDKLILTKEFVPNTKRLHKERYNQVITFTPKAKKEIKQVVSAKSTENANNRKIKTNDKQLSLCEIECKIVDYDVSAEEIVKVVTSGYFY